MDGSAFGIIIAVRGGLRGVLDSVLLWRNRAEEKGNVREVCISLG